MRRAIRYLVDAFFGLATFTATLAATGSVWMGLLACAWVWAYGLLCFFDGASLG